MEKKTFSLRALIIAGLALVAWVPAEALARERSVATDCSVSCAKGSCSCTGKCACMCDAFGQAFCRNVN